MKIDGQRADFYLSDFDVVGTSRGFYKRSDPNAIYIRATMELLAPAVIRPEVKMTQDADLKPRQFSVDVRLNVSAVRPEFQQAFLTSVAKGAGLGDFCHREEDLDCETVMNGYCEVNLADPVCGCYGAGYEETTATKVYDQIELESKEKKCLVPECAAAVAYKNANETQADCADTCAVVAQGDFRDANQTGFPQVIQCGSGDITISAMPEEEETEEPEEPEEPEEEDPEEPEEPGRPNSLTIFIIVMFLIFIVVPFLLWFGWLGWFFNKTILGVLTALVSLAGLTMSIIGGLSL